MCDQLMPCICCNLPTQYEDIEDKVVVRGSHHKTWCDFYREIKCSECGVSVDEYYENNNYYDDFCDDCWLDHLNADEESIFEDP